MSRQVTPQYDEKKFQELVLYISGKCQGHDRFGGAKLNKILFFADFKAYLERGRPITGAVYQKLQYGPAPRRLLPVKKELIASGAAAEQENMRPGEGVSEKRLIPLRRPSLTAFDAEEIAIVDAIIERFQFASAVGVSAMSHELPGWQLAALNEDIPYFTAHLPAECPVLSKRDFSWVHEVGRAYVNAVS